MLQAQLLFLCQPQRKRAGSDAGHRQAAAGELGAGCGGDPLNRSFDSPASSFFCTSGGGGKRRSSRGGGGGDDSDHVEIDFGIMIFELIFDFRTIYIFSKNNLEN